MKKTRHNETRVILAVPEKPEEHDELDDTYVFETDEKFQPFIVEKRPPTPSPCSKYQIF